MGEHASIEAATAHEQRTLALLDALLAAEQELARLEDQHATAAAQADDLAIAQGFADLAAARAALLAADEVEPEARASSRPTTGPPGTPAAPSTTPTWSPCSTSSPTAPPRTSPPCATSATRRAPPPPRPPT